MVLSSPAYSIGRSKRSTDWKTATYYVPGSGAYNPQKQERNAPPSWRIGTGPRGTGKPYPNPGPGQYENNNTKLTKTSFPKYHFGSRPSSSQTPNHLNTPGPGSYNPDRFTSGRAPPEYSFGFKGHIDDTFNNPGPGAYEVLNESNNIKSRPSSKIGSAKRERFYNIGETPGPGTYNYISNDFSSSTKIRFGTSQRDKTLEGGVTRTVPGPGTYNIIKGSIENNMVNGNWTTIIPRRTDLSLTARAQSPGPGTYNPEKQQVRIPPSFRIGSANRSKFEGLETFPGPGHYEPKSVNRPSSAKHRLGTGQRSNFTASNSTPGPGNYESFSQLKGPKYVIAGKKEPKYDNTNPGPGTYEPMTLNRKAPAHLIGTSLRNEMMKHKDTPGPGQYDVRKDIGGPKYPFGSESRGELYKGSLEPGPGSYNLPRKFADVPKYLLDTSKNF